MPRTKSAKKAFRQSLRRKEANSVKRRRFKTVIKKYEKLIASGDGAEAKEYLRTVYRTLDKAAKSGVLKANTASRLKTRLTKKLK